MSAKISVTDLSLSYGDFEVLRKVNFVVGDGAVLVVIGGSGCGKSTLMKAMIGLIEPVSGSVSYGAANFTSAHHDERVQLMRSFGVLYQGGALWTSMTLRENVALP